MLRSLLKNTIGVAKRQTAAVNSLGENAVNYAAAVTYTNLARVEESREDYQIRDSGTRDNKRNIIYIDASVNAVVGDRIEFPVGTVFGDVITKNPHYKATSNVIDIYELEVERP